MIIIIALLNVVYSMCFSCTAATGLHQTTDKVSFYKQDIYEVKVDGYVLKLLKR